MDSYEILIPIGIFAILGGLIFLAFSLFTVFSGYTIGTQTLTGKVSTISYNNFPIHLHTVTLSTYGDESSFVIWEDGTFNGLIGQTCSLTTSGWQLINYTCI